MIRITHVFGGLFIVLVIFIVGTFACSCASPPISNKSIDEIRKERRDYFLNEFSGAAFIGKIFKRERVNAKWMAKTLAGKPTDFQMYKYTIHVSEYWLGVKSPTIVVYGEPDQQIYGNSRSGSSCGFKLVKGRTYFFTPGFYKDNLMIGQCDFAEGGSPPNKGRATEFREIMGEPQKLQF